MKRQQPAHCPRCDSSNTEDHGVFEQGRYWRCKDCRYQWERTDA